MDKLPQHTRYITLGLLMLCVFFLAAAGAQLLNDSPSSEVNPGDGEKELSNRDDRSLAGESLDAGAAGWVQENHAETEDSSVSVSSNPSEPAPESQPSRHGRPVPAPEKEDEEHAQAAQSQATAPAPEEPPAETAKPDPKPAISDHDTDLNPYVQEVIATYSGYYPYLLNNDYANYNGVTENLYYDNRLLARAHPSGNRASHCVGITFEVFFKAMQERNRRLGIAPDNFNGMTFEEMFDFLLTWYVACGDKRRSNIEAAVERYGLGKRVSSFEDARAGDFMDISRSNGTGHTVVFQEWVRDSSGRITGVRYWSSQGWGIGYNTEYFDTSGYGNVYAHQVYIARVLPVHRYRSFR